LLTELSELVIVVYSLIFP